MRKRKITREPIGKAADLGRGEIILLGLIAALGSLAIQIIVPALPLLAGGIGATARDGQLVISVYLIALATAQLACAPCADRFGRKPVLVAGTIAFLAGSLGCATADTLATMLAGRVLQAIGAAASLVAARTMATDGASDGRTASQLAILSSVILISPALAPVLGGVIAGLGGWRALFWMLTALTVLALAASARLPETRPGDGVALRPRHIATTYLQVARHPRYLRIALANGLINGGFYLFLAVSPFVLAKAGATPARSGLFYSLVACSIILGSLSVPLITRRAPRFLIPFGSAILAAGAIAVIVVALVHGGVRGLLAAMTLISFGAGLTGPTLQAEAIESQRTRASAATSLMGTIQMASAAAISTLVVRVSPSPAISLAIIGGLIAGALLLRGGQVSR